MLKEVAQRVDIGFGRVGADLHAAGRHGSSRDPAHRWGTAAWRRDASAAARRARSDRRTARRQAPRSWSGCRERRSGRAARNPAAAASGRAAADLAALRQKREPLGQSPHQPAQSARSPASTSKATKSAAAGCGVDDAGLVGAIEGLAVGVPSSPRCAAAVRCWPTAGCQVPARRPQARGRAEGCGGPARPARFARPSSAQVRTGQVAGRASHSLISRYAQGSAQRGKILGQHRDRPLQPVAILGASLS